MRHIEIILKVAERCNLNCTYCYFFNKENRDFENHPALISTEAVQHLVRFLRASQEVPNTVFQIDIHGGEPLLLGPTRFSEIISIIESGLHDAKEVNFTVQTNAVLINQAWLDVFSRHQVRVGISVDGPKGQHDANRIDRRGRGTFDRMVPKIAAVKQAASDGRVSGFGSICVISPEADAGATYRCLTQELGFSRLQFLFPDDTHDSMSAADAGRFVKYVEDLFECWENDDRGDVRVQLIDRTLQGILQEKSDTADDHGLSPIVESVVFTVSSAGDIGHDDTLRNVVPNLFNSGMNVADAEFSEFLAWHTKISEGLLPRSSPVCASCIWNRVCEYVTTGDTPLHRMKNEVVDQPSVYCEALKTAYLKGATYLAKRGVPVHEISKNLVLAE